MPCFGLVKDWDDTLAYSTPRFVKIRDRRLGILYYLFLAGIIGYILGCVAGAQAAARRAEREHEAERRLEVGTGSMMLGGEDASGVQSGPHAQRCHGDERGG